MNTFKRIWIPARYNKYGKQHYLCRALDQDGEVVDVYLQARRTAAAAKRFCRRLRRNHAGKPRKILADKLRSFPVAHRELMPEVIDVTDRHASSRAELSHAPPAICPDVATLEA